MSDVPTTDDWPLGKIIKHVFLPKPKDAPKAGKKEIAVRVAFAVLFAALAYYNIFGRKSAPQAAPGDAAKAGAPASATSGSAITQRILKLMQKDEQPIRVDTPIKYQDLMQTLVTKGIYQEWSKLISAEVDGSKVTYLGNVQTAKGDGSFYIVKYICKNAYTPNASLAVRFYKVGVTPNGELAFGKSATDLPITTGVLEEGMALMKLDMKFGDSVVGTGNKLTTDFPAWYQKWDGDSVRMYTGGNKLLVNAVNLKWNEAIQGYEIDFAKGSEFERWAIDHFTSPFTSGHFLVDNQLVTLKSPLYLDEYRKSCLVSGS